MASLQARIETEWEGTSTLPILRCIVDTLCENSSVYIDSNTSLSTFQRIVQDNLNDVDVSHPSVVEDILVSINYLLDPHVGFLETKYELYDEFEPICSLTVEDVKQAEEDGWLVHPVSGVQIDDFKDHVIITFSMLTECA